MIIIMFFWNDVKNNLFILEINRSFQTVISTMLLKQIPEIMINVNLKKNPHFPIGQTMCVFSYSQFSIKKS